MFFAMKMNKIIYFIHSQFAKKVNQINTQTLYYTNNK